MDRNTLVNEIVDNHNTGKWLNCTYICEDKAIGVKAFGKWVQVMQCGPIRDGTVEVRTKKAFHEAVTNLLNGVMR